MKRTKRGIDSASLPLSTRHTDINIINNKRRLRNKRNISNINNRDQYLYFFRDSSKEESLHKYIGKANKINNMQPSEKILMLENSQLKEKIKHLQKRIEKYEEIIRDHYKLNSKKIPKASSELDSIPDMKQRFNPFALNNKLTEVFKKETGIKFHYGKKEKYMLNNFIKKVKKEIPSKLKSFKEPEIFFIKYHVRTIKREKGSFTITPNLLCSNWAWNFTMTEMEKEKREHGKLFL